MSIPCGCVDCVLGGNDPGPHPWPEEGAYPGATDALAAMAAWIKEHPSVVYGTVEVSVPTLYLQDLFDTEPQGHFSEARLRVGAEEVTLRRAEWTHYAGADVVEVETQNEVVNFHIAPVDLREDGVELYLALRAELSPYDAAVVARGALIEGGVV